MKLLFALVALLLSVALPAQAAEYILKLMPHSSLVSLASFPLKTLAYNSVGNIYKVEISDPELVKKLLSAKNKIQYLVPNVKIQLPPEEMHFKLEAQNFGVRAQQWNMEKVNTEAAWQLAGNRGSKKIVVAVIDTGVDGDHPDLKGNIIEGYNFLNNTTNTKDEGGHGTHCAGLIGATGASSGGVFGMSPDVSIMPLVFLTAQGTGDIFTGITAIDYAISKKVDIISASWGRQLSDPKLIPPFREAAERADKANVLLVTAAGNLNRDNDTTDFYPANSTTPSIIAVAATDEVDHKADFSNYGFKNVHIGAPGVNITSTFLNSGYATLKGTSMATPMVAGLAALIKAQRPQLSAAEIRNVIMTNGAPADVQSACNCRIDAEAALRYTLQH